jgi:hypothetical protein
VGELLYSYAGCGYSVLIKYITVALSNSLLVCRMNRLRKSLLKALGSKVLDGLRNLGVRTRISGHDREILTALGRAFSTSLGAFCWIPEGTKCCVRNGCVERW